MEIELKNLIDAENFEKKFNNNVTKIIIKLFDENNKYSSSQLKILEVVEKILKNKQKIPQIIIYTISEKLPKDIFVKICKFYKNIGNSQNLKVAVTHYYKNNYFSQYIDKFWDVKTIMKANTEIERVCKFIKNSNFSPMEAFAYIHGYVQKVANYNSSQSGDHNWFDNDQFFAGSYMKCPEVVCTGYCALMKEIIKTLNMPGLNCNVMTINYEHMIRKYEDNHARCIVNVSDSKYSITQSFFDDPTWDSVANHKYPVFTHFAMRNTSHDSGESKIFRFFMPRLLEIKYGGRMYSVNKFHERKPKVERSKIKMNQQLVEKIYLNVLQKMNTKADFEQIYSILSEITKLSFTEQSDRNVNGYFAKPEPVLTREKAEQIYLQNKKRIERSL